MDPNYIGLLQRVDTYTGYLQERSFLKVLTYIATYIICLILSVKVTDNRH